MKRKLFITAFMVLAGLGAGANDASAAPKGITGCQTIFVSGSYILTKNLRISGDCIIVAADNVTIDLDGYTIEGDGTGQGIGDADVPRQDVTIRNGTVKSFYVGIGFAKPGGEHSVRTVVERIRAIGNTFFGIRSGRHSVVRDCVVSDNGTSGMFVAGGLIIGNTVLNNNSTGILALCPSNFIGNFSSGNGVYNIVASGEGCTYSNNNPVQ